MFDRYTDRGRRVVVLAQEEARLHNHHAIGTEHILIALINEGEAIACQVLVALGLELGRARKELAKVREDGVLPHSGTIPFTPRAKKVLEIALRESLCLGTSYVAPEHILLGLIREGEGVGARLLAAAGLDLVDVRRATINAITGAVNSGPDVTLTMSAATAAGLVKWVKLIAGAHGPYADVHPAMLLLKALENESSKA